MPLQLVVVVAVPLQLEPPQQLALLHLVLVEYIHLGVVACRVERLVVRTVPVLLWQRRTDCWR